MGGQGRERVFISKTDMGQRIGEAAASKAWGRYLEAPPVEEGGLPGIPLGLVDWSWGPKRKAKGRGQLSGPLVMRFTHVSHLCEEHGRRDPETITGTCAPLNDFPVLT